MTINSVNNECNSKQSYIGSTLMGAVGGYGLKWAIPLTKDEKDQNFRDNLRDVKSSAKNYYIKDLKTTNNKLENSDIFINMLGDKKTMRSAIKNSPNDIKLNLISLLSQTNKAGTDAKLFEGAKIKAFKKSIRPSKIFIPFGGLIGLLSAVTANWNSNSTQQPQNEN